MIQLRNPFQRRVSVLLMCLLVGCGSHPEEGHGQNVAHSEQEITFTSRGTTLVGTLYTPAGPGPHPVLIGGHGSGHVDRSDLYQREMVDRFVPQGVAFFMFDKRGVGASEGEYAGSYSSSMVIYAVDLVAALEAVTDLETIDSKRAGFWGMSQAGWTIPVAAAMEQDQVAFSIIVSGPTVSIWEEVIYSELTGETDRKPSGRTSAEINATLQETESLGLDAAAFIAELRMPVLWIYGDKDQSVPWEHSIRELKRMKSEWDRDFTWRVIPNANHGLRASRTGGPWERPIPSDPAPGYFEAMAAWLGAQVGLPLR